MAEPTDKLYPIRIFLASPSDTARDVVAKVAKKVGDEPTYHHKIRIDLQRWDDRSQPVPMAFLRCPQEQVEKYKTLPVDCDLVIGLLRHCLGTSLEDEARYGTSDVTDRVRTGTEWELFQAREHNIEIWVFRDITAFSQDPMQTQEIRQEQQRQFNDVCGFFDRFGSPSHTHEGADDLEEQLARLLRTWLTEHLEKLERSPVSGDEKTEASTSSPQVPTTLSEPQALLKQVLLAGETPKTEDINTVYRESPAPDGIESWLLSRWSYWARRVDGVATDAGELHQHFVTLQMMLDRSRLPDAPPMTQLEGERWLEAQKYDSLSSLLAENPDKSGWVLVGPPGSGKSTVLQHHEMQCCVQALSDNNEEAEVCLWFRLSGYNDESPPPVEWLANTWREQNPAMPALESMQAQFRLRFLLDGLNEIRITDRNNRAEVIKRWASWADKQPGHGLPPIFSVRSNEYSNQLSADGFHATRINLLPWSEEQMQIYIEARLGQGSELWKQINTSELLEFHSLPMTLAHQCELYESYQRPLTQRARMFSGLMWLRLQRLQKDVNHDDLLTDRDRQKITDEPWRDERRIHFLPTEGCLISALERLALSMQQRGNEVSVPLADLRNTLDAENKDNWIQAVQQLQVAELEFNDNFRFLHQSWQEYFAARALCHLDQGQFNEIDFSSPAPASLQEELDKLAIADPLPVPAPSRWEETVKRVLEMLPALAFSRLDSCIEHIREQNPALAGQAASLVRNDLSEQSIKRLESDLLEQSRDPDVDLRIRIKSALALGELGDPRYQELTGPEGDRYLIPCDEYLVLIKAGEYPIGSAKDDPNADNDELWPDGKIGRVSLDTFRLSFAPVTRAEYECFVNSGGYEDPRWWNGELAEQWFRGEFEETGRQDWWRRFWQQAQVDQAQALEEFQPNASEHWKETSYKTFWNWSESDLEGWLTANYGAGKRSQPEYWDDPAYSSPTQPIVGVSWFEACAYCEWLSFQTSIVCSLATEMQWEAAARGHATSESEGRPWPWGHLNPSIFQINALPAHLRKTTPVGVFPESDTPDELYDMAGNVWEWCADLYGSYGSDKLAINDTTTGGYRVLRGGSWFFDAQLCRSAYRDRDGPSGRSSDFGFRFAQVTGAQVGAERPATGKK